VRAACILGEMGAEAEEAIPNIRNMVNKLMPQAQSAGAREDIKRQSQMAADALLKILLAAYDGDHKQTLTH